MSTLTDQVRSHLCKAQEAPTAAVIAQVIGASPLVVGNALDELRGLGHAREDGLHRWRITDKGRLNLPPASAAPKPSVEGFTDKGIRETAITLLRQHGDKTPQELADIFPHYSKTQYGANLSVAKHNGEAHVVGTRNGMKVWRAGPAPKGNGEAKAGNIDRAAVARQHDAEEAATPKCERCGRPRSLGAGRLCRECYTGGAKVNQEVAAQVAVQTTQDPDPPTLPATLATCRRIHAEAEEAVRAYLAALEATDPQLKALIAVRDAAAIAVEALE